MRSIVGKLAPKHRQRLALLHETETQDSLEALIKLMRDNCGRHSLQAIDWDGVKYLQGQALGLKMLVELLKEIHEKEQKS